MAESLQLQEEQIALPLTGWSGMWVDRFFISKIGLTGAQDVMTLEVRSLGRDPLHTKPQPYTNTTSTNTHPLPPPIAIYFT